MINQSNYIIRYQHAANLKTINLIKGMFLCFLNLLRAYSVLYIVKFAVYSRYHNHHQ